jgi:hypothetical protein
MRLLLEDAPCLRIDLRATGLLGSLGHDPTLSARAARLAVEVGEGPLEIPLEVSFAAAAIEVPADIPASDRMKMRDNMLSREVLDAVRFPHVDFRGRYTGTLDRGTLSGDLLVRGTPRSLTMPVSVAHSAGRFVVTGRWEGRLSALGIKPFKALLGALKLEDRVVLRLEALLREEPS